MANTSNATIRQALNKYRTGPPPSKGSGEWVQHPQFESTRDLLARSFAGTDTVSGNPEFDWAAEHLLESEKSWYTREQHRQTVSFLLGFHIYNFFQKNTLVVSRRMTGDGSGDLASAAIIVEYNKKDESRIINKIVDGWNAVRAFFKIMTNDGLPELLSNSKHKKQAKHLEKKGQGLIKTMEEVHKTDGPDETHWYVAIVGVGPEHKGKGYGGELMKKVGDLADDAGIMCYLECGTKNKAFYEKMGYREYSKHLIEDPVDPSTPAYEIYAMVRDPLPPARAKAY